MKKAMKYYLLSNRLIFLMDSGVFLDSDTVKEWIDSQSLFKVLRESYNNVLGISSFEPEEIAEMQCEFEGLSSCADYRLDKNGICLLIAYCAQIMIYEIMEPEYRR